MSYTNWSFRAFSTAGKGLSDMCQIFLSFVVSQTERLNRWGLNFNICVIILHVDGQNQFYLSGFYITFLCSLLMQEKLSKDNLKDEQLFFKVGHHLMHCPPLHHLLLSFRFLRNRNHIFQKWALNMQTNEQPFWWSFRPLMKGGNVVKKQI